MKKYNEEDLEKFKRIDGRIICPSGDYTEIKKFPENCSFSEGCSFGEWSSFENCTAKRIIWTKLYLPIGLELTDGIYFEHTESMRQYLISKFKAYPRVVKCFEGCDIPVEKLNAINGLKQIIKKVGLNEVENLAFKSYGVKI